MDHGAEVHGYFYNPNIHPYTELKLRRDAVEAYNTSLGITYTIDQSYGLRPFLDMQRSSGDRCVGCYRMRFDVVARFASENGFRVFTSTLLYSRYQRHEQIMAEAEAAALRHGVDFYYEDYRKGWQVGIDISKSLGIYRQKYCGCIFSEEERYCGRK